MRARRLPRSAGGERSDIGLRKLKFFRLAFGSAGGYGDTVPPDEARQAIEGMFASSGRVKVGWLVPEEAINKRAVKVLLNLALIAGDALVRGGQLDIGVEVRTDAVELAVRGQGQKIVLDEELRAAPQASCVMRPSLPLCRRLDDTPTRRAGWRRNDALRSR